MRRPYWVLQGLVVGVLTMGMFLLRWQALERGSEARRVEWDAALKAELAKGRAELVSRRVEAEAFADVPSTRPDGPLKRVGWGFKAKKRPQLSRGERLAFMHL
jgi:hypothetical protein